MSARAQSVLLAWAQQQRFSTAPVECEHKQVTEEIVSITSGAAHTQCAYRSVCRQLHQVHMHRGGAHLSLKLRRPVVAGVQQAQGRCWPQWPVPNLSPLLDRDIEATSEHQLGLSANTAQEVCEVTRLKLGGGNPKMVFINYKLHMAKESRSNKMSRAEVQAFMRGKVAEYDQSLELQTRWRTIFDALRKRKMSAASEPSLPIAHRSSDLWPGHMRPADEAEDGGL